MSPENPSARCLVTGTSGRLGQLLRRAWQNRDAPPAIWMSRGAAADVTWSPGTPMPDLPRCDSVIALWGRTSGTAGDLAVNVDLVAEAETLAQACDARRVLHFSSAAVYGPGIALSETAPTRPIAPYGHSKLAMEAAIRALPRDTRRHCCLRLANVVGADSLAPALTRTDAPVMLDRFADGGGPVRSYVAPGDLADIIMALVALPPDQLLPCLNVTAPIPVSMESLAQAAGRPVIWREAAASAVQTVTLDGSRLARLFPFLYPKTTADQMIEDWRTLEAAI